MFMQLENFPVYEKQSRNVISLFLQVWFLQHPRKTNYCTSSWPLYTYWAERRAE